jgi:hypothetical protein
MAENQSSNVWIGQFVLRLMELRPSIPMLDAVQYAVFEYPYAQSLEPEQAAAIFAGNTQLLAMAHDHRRKSVRPGAASLAAQRSLG